MDERRLVRLAGDLARGEDVGERAAEGAVDLGRDAVEAVSAKTGTTSAPAATDAAASCETWTCMEFLRRDRSGRATVKDNLFAFTRASARPSDE